MEFINQQAHWLSLGTVSLASALVGILFCVVIYQLVNIYRRNFLREVDSGLQDLLLYMDPRQLLQALLLALVILIPTSLYFLNIGITLILVVIVLSIPKVVLPILRKRRHTLFAEQLPDTLVSIATGMRSGLNLVQAMQQVVKNQPPPISQEFAQVLLEYRVGKDLVDSLESLYSRVPREELVLVNSAISIAQKVGGNLSDTFESLADTLREKMKIEGRIEALTSMGRAQAWLAVFFPVIMGYLFYKLEPNAMIKLFTTPGGWISLSIMFFMILIASVLIRKIVDIDV